ncbi:Relaxase/Mobilisation nuclease domain-containing protein [Maribacter aquivivus]|uniref:Relaxase/Mobilisation nuclease domain-containing protein n=1 Tax=Maribacter aquivivus TaxID=228958 RepID=A0A1M6U503_9FLAO|nr:relaxase/mobilization nuclease domain-containing protein [Maribacter aquivivus]SHK64239.1 Relaxase/Mobilisation nuclease domain-containing protein [Maribacter aquivivus]
MIGKGKSISHTNASMSYGMNQEKDASIVLKEYLAGETPQELTKEFEIIQSMNENCNRNTLSFVLSPTIEDGKKLSKNQLGTISRKFIENMNLTERQAIAFVHRDKAHTHIHLYVNRIDFKGKAYPDSFIGKRSNEAARQVAVEMDLKTVKEVQAEKLKPLQKVRNEIHSIHLQILKKEHPKTFNDYIKKMASRNVEVIPSINKGGKLQGFRFEYKGINLKGSEVHRSMSGGKIANGLSINSSGQILQHSNKAVNIAGRVLELSTNMIMGLTKKAVKQIITKGIEIGL